MTRRRCTEDPAVVAWRIILAPRPRPLATGRHWWRELVTGAWQDATDAWEKAAEAVAIGYPTELAEYAEAHPRPRLRDFMVHLSQGRIDPGRVTR